MHKHLDELIPTKEEHPYPKKITAYHDHKDKFGPIDRHFSKSLTSEKDPKKQLWLSWPVT